MKFIPLLTLLAFLTASCTETRHWIEDEWIIDIDYSKEQFQDKNRMAEVERRLEPLSDLNLVISDGRFIHVQFPSFGMVKKFELIESRDGDWVFLDYGDGKADRYYKDGDRIYQNDSPTRGLRIYYKRKK